MTNRLQFSVNDGFELLSTKIELPLAEYTVIASKQAEIETLLGQYISTFTTVLPGAFSRRTLVSPLAGCSISMYILFKYENRSKFTPAELFDKLLVTLKHRYDTATLSRASSAVIVPFKDFEFRVQPGFVADDKRYLVPSPDWHYWLDYNSLAYKESLAKANSGHKGKLIPLIRMLKSWNHVNGNYFNDYYLELLTKDMMANHTIKNYPDALCHIFRSGLLQTAYKKQDPANLEFEIEGLRDITNLVKVMLHFKAAYKLAKYAVKYEAAGNTDKALENWRELLPGCFPTNVDMVIGQIKTLGIKGIDALKLMQEAHAKK